MQGFRMLVWQQHDSRCSKHWRCWDVQVWEDGCPKSYRLLSYLHTNIHTSHGVIFIGGFKYPWLLQTFFSDNPLLIVRRRAIFAVEDIGSVSWKEREGWLDLGLFADKPSVTNISQELPKSPNNLPKSPKNQQSTNISLEPTSKCELNLRSKLTSVTVNVIGRLKKVQPTKPTRSDSQNKDVSYWFCTHAGAGKDVD